MIELDGVSKKYGDTVAVNQVSLKVEEEENLILLGTSGCGKTTTLKMMNRLIQPDQGKVIINGENVLKQNTETLRRSIGYVMQNIGLFPHYTVEDNIAVVPKLLKWDKKKTDERIRTLISKLRLSENNLKLFPGELSGGQQQRVGLARALVANPPILLMDEPFGAVDNVTRTSIQQEFKDLDELKKKTIVMVTHDVQEAFELGDRICLMDKGSIMQIGTPKELLFKPENDFARKFLDGQRLALEFKVLKIKDMWSQIPDAKHTNGEIYNDEDSVWTVMEKFRSDGTNTRTFSNAKGEFKTLNFDQLLQLFNQYKNTLTHE